ncbi:GGDEF domain-containing protein [Marinomonas arctica]|uniref:diguanylate cyclase n=2 Tax=Oceanospirillaceae TaxID=135620 RepID=A0A7H1JCG7_9GAMM|nr:diguanylate cyclase [Marinomonas sp. BSi20414]QNT08183.1 GGDEF domain-containing protein [Marinomonas arctica]
MLFFCFLNISILKQTSIGMVDGILGVLSLYFFVTAHKQKIEAWHRYSLILSLTVTTLFAFYLADLRAGSIYWLLILPPLYCLLAGARQGLILTILLSFPVIMILFLKSETENYLPYRSVLNFSLAYFFSYAICYLYETQYARSSELLHKMAFQDPLTGTQNRHALKVFFDEFNKQSEACFQTEQEETRLLILDIDHFKSVNDEFGHDVGDQVLVEIAELLHDCIQSRYVYRIGGEEFLIILDNSSPTQAFAFAESIRKSVENAVFRTHQQNIKITVSIGIAQLKKGQTFREFLRVADKNLYSAKNEGRNLVHYGSISVTEAI